jgi:integrase/recombinase XerD
VLEDSPMRKVAMPKQERKIKQPFTPSDIEALLAACERENALRDRAIILGLLDTGLRASEFVAMNVGDVDTDGMIKVMGKGRKERYVRLGATARKAVMRYLVDRGDTKLGEALWVGRKGRLTVNGLEQATRRLGKRAGVSPSNPHRFRRTFATWSAAAGIDAHSLRFLLGHESLEIARRYVEMAKADIEEAHKRTSPVDNFLNKSRR